MKEISLYEIALARSGDKGSNANIAVIARKKEDFPFLVDYLTEERVKQYFSRLPITKVKRYRIDNLFAMNFVLYGALKGGGSLNLSLDAQGKALGQGLLQMKITCEDG